MVEIGLEFSIIVDGVLHRIISDRRTVEYLTAWQQTIVKENSGLTGELVQNNDRILTWKAAKYWTRGRRNILKENSRTF